MTLLDGGDERVMGFPSRVTTVCEKSQNRRYRGPSDQRHFAVETRRRGRRITTAISAYPGVCDNSVQ